MFEAAPIRVTDSHEFYEELARQLTGLLADERDIIANAANTASLIFNSMADLNWAGFYFLRGDVLVLGPFQGKPACVRIPLGRGVCGAAAAGRQTLRVADVHVFPDHIACDSASRSELVIPLIRDGTVLGVLDLDSPSVNRFTADDQTGLERIAAYFVSASDPL